MRRTSKVLLAWLLLACATAHGRVIELHANSGFDGDVAGVVATPPAGGNVAWSTVDLTGDPDSGSISLTGPPGLYQLYICVLPEPQLKPIRHFFQLSVRARGGVGSSLVFEGIFTTAFEPPNHPCEGAFAAWVRRYSQVAQSTRVDASIAAYAWPGLGVNLQVTKSDGEPLLIDDWSVQVDEDMIFRDDDQPATVFSL